jgi:two-component system, NarL family, nitrate/nitrite response regulator NarL
MTSFGALHPSSWSVLIVENSRLAAEALGLMLEARGWASNAETVFEMDAAVSLMQTAPPDIVLVSMTGPESLERLATLCDCRSHSAIVAFAIPDDEQAIIGCAELGVAGLLPTTGTVDELEDIVAEVMRGETAVNPRVAAVLLRRVASLAPKRASPAADERLTRREREVLTLIELGWTNKQIAYELNIEVRTVKNHVHNVLEKLRVSRRGEAAARFRATHRVDPDRAHPADIDTEPAGY